MNTHTFQISELAEQYAASLSITYTADDSDNVSMVLTPERYAALGLAYGDRITLKCGSRTVFSGTITSAPGHSVSADSAESINITAESDFALLQRMAYCKLGSDGKVLYPAVSKNARFVGLDAFTSGVMAYAKGWSGSPIKAGFECTLSRSVPAPQGNGATPCASLMLEASSWVPEAVLLHRHAEDGGTLTLTSLDKLPHVALPKDAPITDVSLQARPDMVPPVCALIGGAHLVLPADGDVREPGAFLFTVPVDKDKGTAPAGSAAASSKTIIRGFPIPERCILKRHKAETDTELIPATSNTWKYLSRFFPQYTPYLPYAASGACLISVVPAEELNAGEEPTEDEDAQPVPANYSADIENWGAGTGTGGNEINSVYVLTEGSFPASHRSVRNLKSLRWCKATLSIVLSMSDDSYSTMPDALKPGADELFPGRVRKQSEKSGNVYVSHKTVRLNLDAILINRRKRLYDPATMKPCKGDAEYSENDAEATMSDYIAAMTAYYEASRTLYHEGSVGLLHDDTGTEEGDSTTGLCPEKLLGSSLTLQGKRGEWESMNAIIRGVTWDCNARRLTLTLGTRSALGFNEYLERRMLLKQTREDTAQRMTIAYDPADTDAAGEAADDMTVSPSINASVAGGIASVYRKPFTLYTVYTDEEGENTETWLAGGTLSKNGQTFNVPDSLHQIVNGEEGSLGWTKGGKKLKLSWHLNSGRLTYSITQEQ